MTRLGELLLERGWITRSDLRRALEQQRLLGGRVGTALVEAGALSEELLLRALAQQHGVEPVEIDDLRNVPGDVVDMLPKKVAVRCRAVPVQATTSRLSVAMLDPGNLDCQDEVAFASGRRITVLVANELRLLEALERYYDEQSSSRVSNVLDRLNRSRYLWRDDEEQGDGGVDALFNTLREAPPLSRPDFEPSPATAGGSAAAGAGSTPSTAPPSSSGGAPTGQGGSAGADGAGTDGAGAEAGDGGGPSAAPPPGRPSRASAVTLSPQEKAALYGDQGEAPFSFGEVEERLEEATDRDRVGRLLVGFLRQMFERVILFGVRRDGVTGWMGEGEGLRPERIQEFRLSFDRPSIFLNLRQGSAFHLGPLPPLPAQRPLRELLGGEAPECLMLPLRLGGRMVAVVYADRAGESLGQLDLESLRDLAQRASRALERCILLKRQGQTGARSS